MRIGSRAIKKLFLIGVGSALMFTMGGVGPAQADGGKHISTAQGAGVIGGLVNNAGGRCAGCHRAHTAKAEYLLKVAQPQLCYSCHQSGGGAVTDVSVGLINGTGSALRGGGFDKALIGSALATKDTGPTDTGHGYPALNQNVPVLAISGAAAEPVTTSKHLIDGIQAGTAWGNGTDASGAGKSLTLECGSCHDPHGNGNFRVLRPIPVDSGFKSRLVHAATPFKAGTPAVTAVIGVVDDPATPANEYVEAVAAKAATSDQAATANVYSDGKGVNIPDEPGTAREYTTTNYWLSGKSNVPLAGTMVVNGIVVPNPAQAAALLTGTSKSTDVATDGTVLTVQKTDGYISNIANWCTTCHSRYLAESGSYGKARVGASGSIDTNFTYQHRSDANYKGSAANCITCHVSHGSNATMDATAQKVANPGAPLTAFGDATSLSPDSKLLRIDNRGTCAMCHNV